MADYVCFPACMNGGFCEGTNDCLCPAGYGGNYCQSISPLGFPTFKVFLGFCVIAVTSFTLGKYAKLVNMPVITGYLVVGILAGPSVLNLVPPSQIRELSFIDSFSLAFITFAAGGKLLLKDLAGKKKVIGLVTVFIFVFEYLFGTLIVYAMANSGAIKFMKEMSSKQQWVVSILVSSIMCARSPSALIAIVEELRAAGPFTSFVLGVTTVTDMAAIIMFSISLLIATSIFSKGGLVVFGFSIAQLVISFATGGLLGKVAPVVMWSWHKFVVQDTDLKRTLVDLLTCGLFLLLCFFLYLFEDYAHLYIDNLITWMIAGFVVVNYSHYHHEMHHLQDLIGPWVFVAFFTLTGAALQIKVLGQAMALSVVVCVVRLFFIWLGSFCAISLNQAVKPFRWVAWMTCITQAGVSLGLAKKIHANFPEWGADFATVIFAVVVLNQFIGPPLTKVAFSKIGEANKRASGTNGHALVLSQQGHDSKQMVYLHDLLEQVGWTADHHDISGMGGEESQGAFHVKLASTIRGIDQSAYTEGQALPSPKAGDAVDPEKQQASEEHGHDDGGHGHNHGHNKTLGRIKAPDVILCAIDDDELALKVVSVLAVEFTRIRLVMLLPSSTKLQKAAKNDHFKLINEEGENTVATHLPGNCIVLSQSLLEAQFLSEILTSKPPPTHLLSLAIDSEHVLVATPKVRKAPLEVDLLDRGVRSDNLE